MTSPESLETHAEFEPNRYVNFRASTLSFDQDTIRLGYELESRESGPTLRFEERILFHDDCGDLSAEILEAIELVSNLLHHVAGVSYYKLAAPKKLEFPTADSGRGEFLRSYFEHGLAEFAYLNKVTMSDLEILAPASPNRVQLAAVKDPNRVLVPFGGGKDSLLTVALLRDAGYDVTLLVVGPSPVAEILAKETGLPLIVVSRVLDEQVMKLNGLGALNGHVPVTAVISVISIIVALRGEFSAVIMSNEQSANKGTRIVRADGTHEVNHQFSKSFEFEEALQLQLASMGITRVEYFSLLRPFTELAICNEFARRIESLSNFVSCNQNFRRSDTPTTPAWCLRCSKCLFVHLSMAPFLSGEKSEAIFGGNPLNDLTLLKFYASLLEVEGEMRPFDCVGDAREAAAAFSLLAKHPEKKTYLVVRHFLDSWAAHCSETPLLGLLNRSDQHQVPPRFEGALNAVL